MFRRETFWYNFGAESDKFCRAVFACESRARVFTRAKGRANKNPLITMPGWLAGKFAAPRR
jgi:hypothetical protein